jgi:hypothetical protein
MLRQVKWRSLVTAVVVAILTLGPALPAARAEEDTSPPTLTYLSLTPQAVDVTQAPQVIQVEARVTDDLSGVNGVSVRLRRPAGANGYDIEANWTSSTNGTWLGTIQVPQYVTNGQWIVAVHASDNVGNNLNLEGQSLVDRGYPGFVQVTSNEDTVAPTVQAFTLNPDAVDVRTAPQVVQVNLSASDDLSGVLGAYVALSPPKGPNGDLTTSLISEGTGWIGTIEVPQYVASGDWEVRLTVWDAAGNNQNYSSTRLQTEGFDYRLTVTSNEDTVAPVLERVTLTPEAVDVSTSSQIVEGQIKTYDDMSGVQSVTVILSPPSGYGSEIMADFELDTNAAEEGIWNGVFHFPQYIEEGDWMARLMIYDNVGNQVRMNSSQLAAAGYPNKITVTNNPAQMATSATLTPLERLLNPAQ